MNHLILGCGYLGRRVARLWLAQGHHVAGVTRRAEAAAELRNDGVEPIRADVLRPDSLRGLAPADTVLYAVGLDRTSGASMRAVYVDGLANVLDHLPGPRLPALPRFIYVSSSSVYGQTDGDWVDEDSPTEPREESGKIVLEAERLLHSRRPGAIVLRFAGMYGPGRLLREKTIRAGELIVGDADKWLNLIHVEDGARAVLAAQERGQPGRIYNICDDHPVRRRDFYSELARRLGAPAPRFTPPPPDQPTPPHEQANRRLRNRRMHEELHVALRYPSFQITDADPPALAES
ncbi:MAG: SDR family oxidoreductase [Gemmataceae bacterium]|nr:SDR family oxidoreductase [Gemmataceae bacterium]